MSNETLIPLVPKRTLQKRYLGGKKVPDQQQQKQNPRAPYKLIEHNLQAEVAHRDFALGTDEDQMDNHHETDRNQHYQDPEVDEPPRSQPLGVDQQGVEVANPSEYEADKNTVWIDSDEEDPEELVLERNFFLPYCDHNYDCCDPSMRVMWPQEGVFPIIDGLSEEGKVIRQYMPKGYEHLAREVEEDDELPPRQPF